jgi:hypothetical protein
MMVSTGTSSKSGFEFTFQIGLCAGARVKANAHRTTVSQVSGLPHESHLVMS